MDQKGNGLILGIIIGAFVIILAVGGYYLGKQSNIPTNTPYIQTNPQITSAPQTTIPPKNQNIDTSSWKTYTQAIIPFTVQYPSTWTVFEQNESNNAGAVNNSNLQRQAYFPSVRFGEVIANPTFSPTPPDPCVYKDGQGFCGDATPEATSTFPVPITPTATLTRVIESPTPLASGCFMDANGNVICVINISMSPTPEGTPIDPNCSIDAYGNKICVIGNTPIAPPTPISITVGTTVSGSPVPFN